MAPPWGKFLYGGKGGPLQKGVILGNLGGSAPPPMEICQRRAWLPQHTGIGLPDPLVAEIISLGLWVILLRGSTRRVSTHTDPHGSQSLARLAGNKTRGLWGYEIVIA